MNTTVGSHKGKRWRRRAPAGRGTPVVITSGAPWVWVPFSHDDALISVGYAREFGAAIANSRVEIVRDAGHIPQAKQKDATLALLRDFLARD